MLATRTLLRLTSALSVSVRRLAVVPKIPLGAPSVAVPPKPLQPPSTPEACGTPIDPLAEEEEAPVPMVDPSTGEWGGPTRGGTRPEPTRFGDWERNGRCSDF